MRLFPSFGTKKTVDPNDPTSGQTLDALMLRQKSLLQQAPEAPKQIASPWQGAALLGNTLVNSLQQSRAMEQEKAGRDLMAKTIAGINYDTGITPEQSATLMRLDPDTGLKFISDAITARREAAKPLTDVGKLNADLKAGRITQAEYDAQVGGGPAKLTDIGSLRDDYVKAATTYDQAAPSFESMKQAADTALNPNLDIKGKGAADYNMIVAYAKLLDPNSVVREGEVKSASLTGGLVDQLNGWLNIVKGEGSLSDDVRRGIMTEANSRMKAYYDQVKGKRDWLTGVATRHRILPEDVAPPLGEFQPWGQKQPEQITPQPTTPGAYEAGKVYEFEDEKGNKTKGRFKGGDPHSAASWEHL
jgi:hypothetical protein